MTDYWPPNVGQDADSYRGFAQIRTGVCEKVCETPAEIKPGFRTVSHRVSHSCAKPPILQLIDLRRRFPQVTLGYDRRNERPTVSPAYLARQLPGLLEALAEAKPHVASILDWEATNHKVIELEDEDVAAIEWLMVCGPAFWATGWRLYPWTSPVADPVSAVDLLMREVGRGPANPGFGGAIERVHRLIQLEREGVL